MPTDINESDIGPSLLELRGHEVVYGPLYEPLRIRLHSRGVSIQRVGLLRSLFGRDSQQFRYADLVPHGSSILLGAHDEEQLPFEVTGAAARLLHYVLSILGDARSATIVASTGSCPTRMGFEVNGVVLGGPTGLLVVPSGLFGLLAGGTLRIDLAQLQRATTQGTDLLVETNHPRVPSVRMGGDLLTLRAFARWWSRAACVPSAPGDAPLPVLWELVEDGAVRVAHIQRRPWGIRIRADDRSTETACSGLRIHQEGDGHTPGEQGSLTFTATGLTHRVWFLGGPQHAEALRAHLQAVQFESRTSDYVATAWKSCSGDWQSAQIHEPGVGERLMQSPTIDVTPTDFILRCDLDTFSTSLTDLFRRHVQLELANPRHRLALRCVFRRADVVRHEDPDETPYMAVSLLPLGAGPERLPSRRASVRVELTTPVGAQLEGLPSVGSVQGTLVDLSSGGLHLHLHTDVPPSSHVLHVCFPAVDGRPLRLACKVVHSTKRDGGYGVGVRFTDPSERVRTQLQREVHNLQRVERRMRLNQAEEAHETPAPANRPSAEDLA